MTVGELKKALSVYEDDTEVITKKTDIFGNVGYVNSVTSDKYAFFGRSVPCVLLTDEFAEDEEVLNDMPSAQPEIVRCNECKYAHITYGGEVKYCDIWFPDESHYMDTDNYCSFAERSEE